VEFVREICLGYYMKGHRDYLAACTRCKSCRNLLKKVSWIEIANNYIFQNNNLIS